MITDQLFLFPEYNHFIQKEKDIDFIYLDEAKDSLVSNKKYSWLPKKRYVVWKIGGVNPYMPELGPIFPYVYDQEKGVVKTIRIKHGEEYPRFHCQLIRNGETLSYKPKIHIIVGNAFVENPIPEKFHFVHHKNNNPLDYKVENLQHVNRSINQENVKPTKFGSTHDNYMIEYNDRTKDK